MDSQFRIGGVYFQRNGVVAKVLSQAELRGAPAVIVNTQWAPPGLEFKGGGGRDSHTGKYVHWESSAHDHLTLLPGELHQVNGEWIPLAGKPIEEKPEPKEVSWAEAMQEVARYVESKRERLFAPLPKPEPKADRWEGFIVHSDNSKPLPEEKQHKLASLGSMSHQLGSAWKK